ncbi:MAG: hypothetical protein PHH82_04605 [Candidatus ainarchaeum sp.]|nr:hypothetical protein [Candidatus ainarchaeum sp.]
MGIRIDYSPVEQIGQTAFAAGQGEYLQQQRNIAAQIIAQQQSIKAQMTQNQNEMLNQARRDKYLSQKAIEEAKQNALLQQQAAATAFERQKELINLEYENDFTKADYLKRLDNAANAEELRIKEGYKQLEKDEQKLSSSYRSALMQVVHDRNMQRNDLYKAKYPTLQYNVEQQKEIENINKMIWSVISSDELADEDKDVVIDGFLSDLDGIIPSVNIPEPQKFKILGKTELKPGEVYSDENGMYIYQLDGKLEFKEKKKEAEQKGFDVEEKIASFAADIYKDSTIEEKDRQKSINNYANYLRTGKFEETQEMKPSSAISSVEDTENVSSEPIKETDTLTPEQAERAAKVANIYNTNKIPRYQRLNDLLLFNMEDLFVDSIDKTTDKFKFDTFISAGVKTLARMIGVEDGYPEVKIGRVETESNEKKLDKVELKNWFLAYNHMYPNGKRITKISDRNKYLAKSFDNMTGKTRVRFKEFLENNGITEEIFE